MASIVRLYLLFFFNDTATTEIYTLSLHDALPICSLFACLASARLAERRTYLALAIARRVRRSTFEWAAREAKSPLEAPRSEDPRETNSSESAADSFERAALLRHFFGRAVAAGTLTPGELDLLITFKLEGGAENGAFSNAERQRLKRLLGKLRKLASGGHRTRL